jgi:hypothetical protein
MTMLIALLLSAAAHPCADDAQRLCSGVKPGQGRVMACLKQHEAQLSDDCKEKRADFKEEVHEAAQACKPDAEKFCKDVHPGGGRIIACLKQHAADLSPECKAAGGKLREEHGGRGHGDEHQGKDQDGDDRGGKDHGEGAGKGRAMAACRADAQKLCADVRPGGGRIIDCLQQQQAQVSAGCAAALPK